MSKKLTIFIILVLFLSGCSTQNQAKNITPVANSQVETVASDKDGKEQPQSPSPNPGSQQSKSQSAPAAVPAVTKNSSNSQKQPSVNKTPSSPPSTSKTPSFTPATDRHAWWYTPKDDHSTPGITSQYKDFLNKYHGFYTYNTSRKIIYLTFDAGETQTLAPQILDTLKVNNIKASFFVTKPFIDGCPDVVKRMVQEGHVVGNHTVTHRDMNLLSESEIRSELTEVEKAFSSVTGVTLQKYIRPPSGCFNERSLLVTDQMGYKTVFWSWAYKDWDVNNQPSKETLLNLIQNRSHNGAIILLHAHSKTNADNLQDVINILKSQGYSFGQISDF